MNIDGELQLKENFTLKRVDLQGAKALKIVPLYVVNDLACEKRCLFKGGAAGGAFALPTFNFGSTQNSAG